MKILKMTMLTIFGLASISYVPAMGSTDSLPTAEQVQINIKNDVAALSCSQVLHTFSSESVPSLIELIKNPSSKSAEERELSTVVLTELVDQIKAKCSK